MDPERNRESKESYWEKRRLAERIERDLQQALEDGRNTMPDLVTCPNQSCRYPLRVRFLENRVELSCSNCEFKQTIKKSDR